MTDLIAGLKTELEGFLLWTNIYFYNSPVIRVLYLQSSYERLSLMNKKKKQIKIRIIWIPEL